MLLRNAGLAALVFLPLAAHADQSPSPGSVRVVETTPALAASRDTEARLNALEKRLQALEQENAALRARLDTQRALGSGSHLAPLDNGAMTPAESAELNAQMARIGPLVQETLKAVQPMLDNELKNIGPEVADALKAAQPEIEKAMREAGPETQKALREAQPEIDDAMKAWTPQLRAQMKELGPQANAAVRQGLAEALASLETERKNAATPQEKKALDSAIHGLREALHNTPKH